VTRKTRSQLVTWCTECERWVGIMRGRSASQLAFHRENKIVRHKWRDTQRVCPRSGFTLPDGLVMNA
jgi:hypothetical protein